MYGASRVESGGIQPEWRKQVTMQSLVRWVGVDADSADDKTFAKHAPFRGQIWRE